MGFEWDLTGDDDHDATATLQYRVQGEPEYRSAMPLLRIDDNTNNMLAGSLMFLTPGTTYDVKIDYSDPDGGGGEQTVLITTRAVPQLPDGGRAFHVVPGTGGGDGSEANPFVGIAEAQAQAQPGDVFLLHTGTYAQTETLRFSRAGTADNYIVWKAAGDGEVEISFAMPMQRLLVDASHLWFEGITIRNQGLAILAGEEVENVVISRCQLLNVNYGVRLQRDSRNWYIADNVIVGDNDPNMSNFGGEGVELWESDGHVVAYNRISRTADGISYPRRNCDIYGNDIFDTSDDGIEGDGGMANLRIWGNRIHNARNNGITFQSQMGAPWYIVRNQMINNTQALFKLNAPRRYVVMHNTFVTYHDFFNTPCYRDERTLLAVMRNNLWYSLTGTKSCGEPLLWEQGTTSAQLGWWTNHDYDAFGRGDQTIAEVASRLAAHGNDTGRYVNAVAIDESCFSELNVPGEAPLPVPEQKVGLVAGCPAVDAGEVLPGINDDFIGSAPDMGAYELGGLEPHYGPRPVIACGDGVCNGTESCETCPEDCMPCRPRCGDGICNGSETPETCSRDCLRADAGQAGIKTCGNGVCGADENANTCPSDCESTPSLVMSIEPPKNSCSCRAQNQSLTRSSIEGGFLLTLFLLIRRRN